MSADLTPRQVASGILELLTPRPWLHDQETWLSAEFQEPVDLAAAENSDPECGTTMCVAGAACLVAGLTLRDSLNRIEYRVRDGIYERLTPAELARPLLGLNDKQADYLFYAADDQQALDFLRLLAAADDPSTVTVPDDL